MKIQRPIRTILVGGHRCQLPRLDIEVFSTQSGWRNVRFLVDTGCAISVIPQIQVPGILVRNRGEPLNINVAGSSRRGQLTTIRIRFAKYRQYEVKWPRLISDE